MRLEGAPASGPADFGDRGSDLAGLFLRGGTTRAAARDSVRLAVDEIRYLSREDFGTLMVGLHRVAQLGWLFTVAGTVLPSLPGLSGEANSHSERMFNFPAIASPPDGFATDALAKPAADGDVRWEPKASHQVVELIQGDPYFLQKFGQQSRDAAPGPNVTPERTCPVSFCGVGFARRARLFGHLKADRRRGRRSPAGRWRLDRPHRHRTIARAVASSSQTSAPDRGGDTGETVVQEGHVGRRPTWGHRPARPPCPCSVRFP